MKFCSSGTGAAVQVLGKGLPASTRPMWPAAAAAAGPGGRPPPALPTHRLAGPVLAWRGVGHLGGRVVGHEVAGHRAVLQSTEGAGGQHACRWAHAQASARPASWTLFPFPAPHTLIPIIPHFLSASFSKAQTEISAAAAAASGSSAAWVTAAARRKCRRPAWCIEGRRAATAPPTHVVHVPAAPPLVAVPARR